MEKTSLSTPYGSFEYTRMSFGLCGAAQPTVIKGLYPEELTRRMDSGWYFSNRRRNAHNKILNMIDPTIGHQESSAGAYHHLLRQEGSKKNLFGLISISVWNIVNSVGILVLFVLFYRRGRGIISINTQVITAKMMQKLRHLLHTVCKKV